MESASAQKQGTKPQRFFTDGDPVTERGIRRALNMTILSGVFSNVWTAITVNLPYQMYLSVLQASGKLVGLAGTITSFTMILQLPGAFISEMLKERRPMVIFFAFIQRFLWFIPAFMPLFSKDYKVLAITLVAVCVVSMALGNFITGSWLAWMTDLIPNDKAGNYWGRRMTIVMTVYLGTIFLSGYALDILPGVWKDLPLLGFMVVFFTAGVFSMIDIFYQTKTAEVTPEHPNRDRGMLERAVMPFKNKNFLFLTFAYSAWFFLNTIFAAFSYIFIRQEYGISYHVISFIAGANILGIVAFSRISGYIIDRLSARNYVIFLIIIEPLVNLYWFFIYPDKSFSFSLPFIERTFVVAQPVLVLMIGQFMFGALANAVYMGQMALLGIHAPKHDRSIAMASHNFVVGMISALGPVLAGIFIDHFKTYHTVILGTDWRYMQLIAAGLAVFAWSTVLPLFLKISVMANEMPFKDAVGRLAFYNPIRMARSMYNIITIQNSTDAEARAEAVEELGEENAAIAVKDLVEKMGDPSYEVREAAAKALGTIGSPDAIKAILELLKDEDTDLPITLIRALRMNNSKEGIPVITEKLDSQNPFVQREAARTLGVLGAVTAIPRLWELLKTTNNATVATAVSGALAKLGCHDAIKDVFAHYRVTENTTLKKEMALAMSTMLVPEGGFYEIMTKEDKAFASQPEKLISTFSWSVVCMAERLSSSQTPGRTHHQNVLLATAQKEKAKRILTAYESNPPLAALLAWNIGKDLSYLRFGFSFPHVPGEESVYLDNLYDCDERFGLGMWLIHEMSEAAKNVETVTSLDILIIIHFLSNWCREEATKP